MPPRNDDLPADAANFDPSELITGHNGEDQRIEVLDTRYIRHPHDGKHIMERVCRCQFGNWYLVHSAQMADGEIYDVVDWINPKAMKQFKCPEGQLNDAILDAFREKAFWVFDKTARAVAVSDVIAAGAAKMQSVNLAGRS